MNQVFGNRLFPLCTIDVFFPGFCRLYKHYAGVTFERDILEAREEQ
jgi:hypothetical protein